MHKKYTILVFILVSVCWLSFSSRAVFAATDDGIYTYVFHLLYDGSDLKADPSFHPAYSLIAGEMNLSTQTAPTSTNTPISIRGKPQGSILDMLGKELAKFDYNPVVGKNTVYVPYFSNAKTAIFYLPSTPNNLSIDLSGSSVCNENKICDSAVGETYQNCPSDCPAPAPTTVVPATKIPTASQTTVQAQSTNSTGSDIIWYVVLAIGAIVLLAGWFYYLRKNKSA